MDGVGTKEDILARRSRNPVVKAALFIPGSPENFLPTLHSLALSPDLEVVVASPEEAILAAVAGLHVRRVAASSLSEVVNRLWREERDDILAISDAILAPEGFVAPALAAMRKNLRIATVSFLSNAAGPLSFPNRNAPGPQVVERQDERSLTKRLRSVPPPPQVAPIPVASGAAVLISHAALSGTGPLVEAPSGSFEGSITEFCLRAGRKGFIHMADPGTFVSRPSDLAVDREGSLNKDPYPLSDRDWILGLHPFADSVIRQESTSPDSPFALEFHSARSKITGLRVLIDGTCLGPNEMGTQVSIVSLIRALASRDDIREVGVLLANRPPDYAVDVFRDPKVTQWASAKLDSLPDGSFDVGHRPFHPDRHFHAAKLRRYASRVAVTVYDLIAYEICSYHADPPAWRDYRTSLTAGLAAVDGILAISSDVKEQVKLNRLPLDMSRLFVCYLGTDHLSGDEPAKMPEQLKDGGMASAEFLLTLGTDYSHKNRDLAIRAHTELLSRGKAVSLVMAGAHVPFGSSRVVEAKASSVDGAVVVLPDVSSSERNWLLRHASVVLYPTAAEGFGFLAHEAARMGTPTVNVGFGPLRELGDNAPVTAADWDPTTLAQAVEKLLDDPSLAQSQISAALEAGKNLTWANTASEVTKIYRTLLQRPPSDAHIAQRPERR